MKTPTTDRWRYRRVQNSGYHHEEDVGYPALAAAIVKQAVYDWRDADKMLQGRAMVISTGITQPERTKEEIVSFFRSQWYATLCDIDGDKILRKLKEG